MYDSGGHEEAGAKASGSCDKRRDGGTKWQERQRGRRGFEWDMTPRRTETGAKCLFFGGMFSAASYEYAAQDSQWGSVEMQENIKNSRGC